MATIQKRYAYCIGANSPRGFTRPHALQYAERDAELLAHALLTPPCAFTETRHVIANDHGETVRGLNDFLQKPDIREQDLVVVHFSGHGHLLDGRLYLLCNQTEARDIDISAIEIDVLKRRLADCKARHKLLILDCCHAGGANQGLFKGEQDIENELDQVLQESSAVILAACARLERTRELATIGGKEGGGVLSWIIRAACTTHLNEVSEGDGSLSLKDIQHWIPGIINKINYDLLAEGEKPLPQPKIFHEGQGGGEIWLTEARSYRGEVRQRDNRAHLQAIIANQHDFVEDRVKRFVGREVELRTLRERIDGKIERGGYVVITGDAGQGKSSIIANMIALQGIDTSAYHFVQYNSGDDYRISLLHKLMIRLILKYQLPDYYVNSESYPVLSGNFRHVLADIATRRKQEVIYIDGLDQLTTQATTEQGLGFLPAKLPPGIVIVIGTRPNDTLTQLKMAIGENEVDLYPLGMLSLADFKLLLQTHSKSLSLTLVQRFYAAMQGNALYLDLLAQELQANHTSRPEDLIANIESNPNNIFTITFSRMKQPASEWHHVIRPLLGTLVVAREALTQEQIGHICNVESYRIKEGMLRLGGLLTRLGHEKYTLFHSKLHEYLKEDKEHPEKEYEFSVAEEQQLHAKLADWCSQGTNDELWSNDLAPLDREDYRAYARKHYVTHVHYARDYQRLFAILDKGDYEYGKLRADPSTRATVLDLILGCEDAAHEVTTRYEVASPATCLQRLARLWRYTLLRCSLATQADTYPIEAFQALLALDRETEALDLAELITQPAHKLAALLLVMQQQLQHPDRKAEGIQLYDRACEIAQSMKMSDERSKAFGHLAVSLQLVNEEEKARAWWQAANKETEAITDSDERAATLRNLVVLFAQANMWEQAEKTARTIDSTIEQIEVWGNLALSFRQAGLISRAEAALQAAQTLASTEKGNCAQDRAKSISALALAQTAQWTEAKEVAEKIRDKTEQDSARARIAAASIKSGLWETGWHSINAIVQEYKQSGRSLPRLENILVGLTIDLAQAGQWEDARKIAMVMPNKTIQCRALMGIVSELAKSGQIEDAKAEWDKARTLCAAQLDTVESAIAGIVASALVKAGQIIPAREFADNVHDDNIREFTMSEIAIALTRRGQIEDAQTIAGSINNQQRKTNVLSNIALAFMKAGKSEQAQKTALSIADERQRKRVLAELVVVGCTTKQWEQAQAIAKLINDDVLRATSLEHIISGLVQDGQLKTAETIISSIDNEYLGANVRCHLATVLAQSGNTEEAKKFISRIRNERIRQKAECNYILTTGGLFPSEALTAAKGRANGIPEGDEQREALRNVAIAYARAQLWDEAEKLVKTIDDRDKQDEAREVLAIELAHTNEWDRAITILNTIRKKNSRRIAIIQAWGKQLARQDNRAQREKIAQALSTPEEKASLLVSMIDTLAQEGRYSEQVDLIQQAWLQTNTKDDCLHLFPMIRAFLLQAPEMGKAFYDALAWAGRFLEV